MNADIHHVHPCSRLLCLITSVPQYYIVIEMVWYGTVITEARRAFN